MEILIVIIENNYLKFKYQNLDQIRFFNLNKNLKNWNKIVRNWYRKFQIQI